MPACWLMKAEPETRLEKGVDVKFSIDDLEAIGTSKWDGVRNHEAKKIMQEKMKLGDRVLFYHSNCKTPGVYGLATVSREGYPDFTAWDPAHPYYDPRSNEFKPTWYMVDITYQSRLEHPVTLAALKHLASLSSLEELPESCAYVEKEGLEEIKKMALVNRGRLSVQPVTNAAYELIVKMGQRGGLPNAAAGAGKKKEKEKAATATSTKRKEAAVEPPAGRNERNSKQNATKVKAETSEPENKQAKTPEQTTKTSGKRSAPQEQEHNDVEEQQSTRRRSARLKRE